MLGRGLDLGKAIKRSRRNRGRQTTEQEWLESADPMPMLRFLRDNGSDRKLRLYSVACCRVIFQLLVEKSQGRQILLAHERRIVQSAEPFLEVAEAYADGQIGSDIGTAYCKLIGLLSMRQPQQEPWALVLVALLRANSTGGRYYGQQWEYQTYDAVQCASDAANHVANVAGWLGKTDAAHLAMQATEAAFLRCIFGLQLFRTVPRMPHWLTSKDGTVPKIAQTIYENRSFQDMAVLADSLEEAGCADADILNHCRQPGEHVRGCWVVDLILGMQ
jgi:hypothetical protein